MSFGRKLLELIYYCEKKYQGKRVLLMLQQ